MKSPAGGIAEQDALLSPSHIKPIAYDVNLAVTGPSGFYVEGIEEITIQVGVPLSSFLLHAYGITISSATILPNGPKASVLQVSRQMVSVSFPSVLPVGQHILRMSFSLSIGVNRTDGIYACTWRERPASWIVATHFEPANCRSAFPCFDLPHFKATYRLTIITRELPTQAISNTETEFSCSDKDLDASSLGEAGASLLKRIRERANQQQAADANRVASIHVTRFRRTPPLSTYVLGFWIGHFNELKQTSEVGALVTLYLPPDRLEEGHFSRDVAVRSFDFFSLLFEVPFPLSKLDIICLPQMHGVGMEGFGAVTILQDYLLVTDATDFVRRRRITRLLCHEISHQWFGDIVTPYSFDELWLKESTARLFEYIAVHALEPDWRIWPNFVAEVTYMAMLADASPTSHPIVQQHHGNIRSIIESFDVITYGKGASILRMLAEHLGMDVFVAGMKRFMTAFQYRNASKDDLWAALQEESSKKYLEEIIAEAEKDDDEEAQDQQQPVSPQVEVSKLMEPWLARSGCPAVHVDVKMGVGDIGPQMIISQRPFNLVGTTKLCIVDPEKQRCIPLRLRIGCGGGEGKMITLLVGEGQPLTIDLNGYLGIDASSSSSSSKTQEHQPSQRAAAFAALDAWLVVNDKHSGYFTSVYASHEAWSMVKRSVETGHMSEVEAIGLVCDLMLGIQAAMKADHHSSNSNGNGYNELGLLLARLTELVKVLSKNRESLAWCNGQVFLWDINLLSLLKEAEECEENIASAAAVVASNGVSSPDLMSVNSKGNNSSNNSSNTNNSSLLNKSWMVKMGIGNTASSSSASSSTAGNTGSMTMMMHVEKLAVRIQELVGEMEGQCHWAEGQLGQPNHGKDVLIESLHKLRAVRAKALKLLWRVRMILAYQTAEGGALAAGVEVPPSSSSHHLSRHTAGGGGGGGGGMLPHRPLSTFRMEGDYDGRVPAIPTKAAGLTSHHQSETSFRARPV